MTTVFTLSRVPQDRVNRQAARSRVSYPVTDGQLPPKLTAV
jgi:hypothetical protein